MEVKYVIHDSCFEEIVAIFDTHRDAEEFLLSIAEDNAFYLFNWNLQYNAARQSDRNSVADLMLEEVKTMIIEPVKYYPDIYFKE